MKEIALSKIFNKKEVARALQLYQKAPKGQFAKLCEEQIVIPVLERINQATSQQNNPRYLAYMLEWAIMRTEPK